MSAISLRGREYSPADVIDRTMTGTIIAVWVFILAYGFWVFMPRDRFGIVFLSTMMLVFLMDDARKKIGDRDRLDLALIGINFLVVMIVMVYLFLTYRIQIGLRLGYALEHEYILGLVFVLSLLYLTYRAYGLVFCAVVAVAIIYVLTGPVWPGILRHGGFSWRRIVNVLVFEFQFSGFFGSINQIVATWVSLFLLYAGLLRGYGAFDLILRVAIRTGDYIRSGVAQSAVTASIIIGSITGSQMANAAITGSFTIPMMKDSKLSGETAAGIESVASSGGQIMPPVMGAAAFVMASVLGVGYVNVLIAGLIPALIFYASVVIAVHYVAVGELRHVGEIQMRQYLSRERTTWDVSIDAVRFLVPFFVLIWTLGILRWTVMTAAFWTVILMLVTGISFPLVKTAYADFRQLPQAVWDVSLDTVEGFKYGAVTLAPIAIVVGAINGIVDLLVVSGVPGKISLALLGLSGGILLFAVILAMIVCIILGLGMPTVAAYVIVAFLIAPALITQFGVPQLAAHYFVFYAAMLSGLTPPIAVAVVVASGIAASNFWVTAYRAMKISVVLFILPFAFIYNPELVIGFVEDGFTAQIMFSALIAFFGAVLMTHALNYFRRPVDNRPVDLGIRLVYFALGLLALVYPGIDIRVAAAVIGLVLLFGQKYYVSRIIPERFVTPATTGNPGEDVGSGED